MATENIILDEQIGNIITKNSKDKVLLTGNHPLPDSLYADNLELLLYSSTGKPEVRIHIPDGGYYLQLFLGDFTGDGRSEIMVRGNFGGTGGYQIARIYTYENGTLKEIFNQEDWSKKNTCTATYLDNYKLEVRCPTSSTTFLLDLQTYPSDYLDMIYTADKKIKPNQTASVSYLTEALPVKSIYQPNNDLIIGQHIAGISNSDTLGYVQTRLSFVNNAFTPIDKGVLTLGQTTRTNDNIAHIENSSFYTLINELLSATLFPSHITASLNIQLSNLRLQESLMTHTFDLPSYGIRKDTLQRMYSSPKWLHKLLLHAVSKEHALYEQGRATLTPDIVSIQLKKCSLLLRLDSYLRFPNRSFRQQIYYSDKFNVEKDNLDLILNAINEDRGTLYLDAYILNLENNPISQITNFQLTLYDAKGKVFAKKTFTPLEIGGALRPYEGKRVFLSFFSNEYSLFNVDTSSISWDYTYNTP